MINKTRLSACFAMLFLCWNIAAQGQSAASAISPTGSPSFKPPVAAPFGNSINAGADLYTGTANVSLPIYEISKDQIRLPIILNYVSGAGISPDVFPGIVGSGWDLRLGGSITKLELGTSSDRVDFRSYEYNTVTLDDPTTDVDFDSESKMRNYLAKEAVFNYGFKDRDIYAFEFCGLKGKIYADHEGNFKIKSDSEEELKIEKGAWYNGTKGITLLEDEADINGVFTYRVGDGGYSDTARIRPYIYSFTITDSKGVKYVFGADKNAIEYTRQGMLHTAYDTEGFNLIARKWYLTSVLLPNGEKIQLDYRRGNFFITSQVEVSDFSYADAQGNFLGNLRIPSAMKISSTLTNPSYLEKITTPKEVLQFYWSKANNQLGYNFDVPNPTPTSGTPLNETTNPAAFAVVLNGTKQLDYKECRFYFCKYFDVRGASVKNKFPDKLDRITISDLNQHKVKEVQFSYSNDNTKRLRLLDLNFLDKDGTSMENYHFEYNSQSLPPYLSMQSDHFGYYNGNAGLPYYNSWDGYKNYFSNQTNRDAYYLSREPNVNFSKAEILEKIVIPTRGYTKFNFEQNEYRKYTQNWPNLVMANIANKTAGGVRIKSIETYDADNTLLGRKRFHYTIHNTNSFGDVSSGVLSYIPVYYEEYGGAVKDSIRDDARNHYSYSSVTYKKWSTNSINPQYYYHGPALTYSDVSVEQTNSDDSQSNGHTVYQFSNYDNGYLNRPARQIMDDRAVSAEWKSDEECSMDLERGKVLTETVFNSGWRMLSKTTNEYNDDPARFNDNVRLLELFANPTYSVITPSLRYVGYYAYTYYPYLKSKTVSVFNEAGDALTEKFTYTYDAHRLLKKKEIADSKKETRSSLLTHTVDFPAIPVFSAMAGAHIFTPVQETRQKNGVLISSSKVNYTTGSLPTLFLQSSIETAQGSNPFRTTTTFNSYDSRGNLLELQKPNDVKEVFLWGYNGQYPVAKIAGVDYATVQLVVDINLLNNPATSAATMKTELNKLRTDSRTKGGLITTYTYSPLIGMTSATDPANRTVYYDYDAAGRLRHIKDESGNIITSYCYNFAGQQVNCNSPAGSSGSVYARIEYENQTTTTGGYDPIGSNEQNTYADVVIRLYQDAAFTTPISADNLTVYYQFGPEKCLGHVGGGNPNQGSIVINGVSGVIASQALIARQYADPNTCTWEYYEGVPPDPGQWVYYCPVSLCSTDYILLPGTGYSGN